VKQIKGEGVKDLPLWIYFRLGEHRMKQDGATLVIALGDRMKGRAMKEKHGYSKDEQDENEDYEVSEELEVAAEEILSAVKSGEAMELAVALCAFMDLKSEE